MRPVASRLILILALIGGGTSPLLADNAPNWPVEKAGSAILPEFIPPTVRSNYREAVSDNTAAAISARRAAGEISAKFSDADIRSRSAVESDERVPPKGEPPNEATNTNGARTIVLAANPQDDPKNANISASTWRRTRVGAAGHPIPRSSLAKINRAAHSDEPSHESLAMVGQKVSFFDLLTNPALWKWK